jgi:hypothetical protein
LPARQLFAGKQIAGTFGIFLRKRNGISHAQSRAQARAQPAFSTRAATMKEPLCYFLEKLTNVQCFQLYVGAPVGMEEPFPTPKIQVISSTIHCTWGEYLYF